MNRILTRSITVLLLLASAFRLNAQNVKAAGTVYDVDGTPMIGVGVSVAGTMNGTITDLDGRFVLTASPGATLNFEFLGYKLIQATVPADGSEITVNMEPSTEILDDVIVVGYGAVKKSDLTGSVASVKMDAIADINSTSVDGLLQGRAAGLQVVNTSQDPGSTATIRIRGNSSINGSNAPLVVVNGFPMGDAGALTQINTADIASIEVLKDASASAIYGSRGANGVILVTTRQADEGQTSVTVKHQTVVSTLSDKVDIWYDPMMMAQVTNEEMVNAGLNPVYIGQTVGGIYYPSLLEIQSGKWSNTDWVKYCLRTPITNSTTVSINSANAKSALNANLNYFNDQGIYKKDGYGRFNANIGYNYKLFKTATLSTYSVFSFTDRKVMNGLEYGRNPLWPVYNEDGSYFLSGPTDFGHPLVRLSDFQDRAKTTDFLTSASLDWEIIKELKLHTQFDYRYKTSLEDVYQARTTSQDAYDNEGIAKINATFYNELLSETYLTWNRSFGSAHNLSLMAGHSYTWNRNRGLYTTARGFVNDVLGNENMNASDPALRQIYNDGYYESKLLSFYGRANYSLLDKYLFTFTMRADGSTKFGKNNKWGYFPSGAVSWKMHKEPWMSALPWVSEWKWRVSYGISGNQGINAYQTLDRYGMEKFWSDGSWKTVIGPGYEVGRTGANDRYMVWGGIMNPSLRWETTDQADIGLDASFLNSRLRVTADFYHKNTYNLLREKYLPLTSSYDKIWVNDGRVLNRGVELSIGGDIISTRDWHFAADFIWSLNRNRVLDLGDAVSSGLSKDELNGFFYEVTGPAISMFNQNASILAEGMPMNIFYGYQVDGIIQEDENPGFIDPSALLDRPGELKYVDQDGDFAITSRDRVIIGDPNPDFTASLNLRVSWKQLSLSVFLYGVYGNDVLYNGYTYSPRVKSKRWTPDNPTNDFPSLNSIRQYQLSDYFIQDGSFLRVQNVNLSYDWPVGGKVFRSIRFYGSIDNLLTLTRFDGYDPEVGLDGIYWGGYPKFRKFTFGVDLNF